jgi:DNA-binding HxlR family transcriptional regulator
MVAEASLEKVRVSRGGGKPAVANPGQALALIADKWAVLVITTLADGGIRYNALRREIAGVSQKMLTQTLRDLECNGLVERTVHPDTPPRVEYGLTPLGLTLVEALTVLRDWANEHYHEVEAARRRYCGEPAGAGGATRKSSC